MTVKQALMWLVLGLLFLASSIVIIKEYGGAGVALICGVCGLGAMLVCRLNEV